MVARLSLSGSDRILRVNWEKPIRSAGLTAINHDFYPGGRHEMIHEVNCRDGITNLLVWLSGILERLS